MTSPNPVDAQAKLNERLKQIVTSLHALVPPCTESVLSSEAAIVSDIEKAVEKLKTAFPVAAKSSSSSASKHADPTAPSSSVTSKDGSLTLSAEEVRRLHALLGAQETAVHSLQALADVLSTRSTTTTPGSPSPSNNNSAASRKIQASPPKSASQPRALSTAEKNQAQALWAQLRAKLPRDKNPAEVERRAKLWESFDYNGNGHLSVAEAHGAVKYGLGLGNIAAKLQFNLQEIVLHAHTKAKASHSGNGPLDDDYIQKNEFRLFLVYLYDYIELWMMFSEMDKDGDHRVSLSEFIAAIPKIKEWGLTIKNPEATFREIDTNGGGLILFDEFVPWACAHKLDMDGDRTNL